VTHFVQAVSNTSVKSCAALLQPCDDLRQLRVSMMA